MLVAGLALGALAPAALALECPALQAPDGSGRTPDLAAPLAQDPLRQVPGVLGFLKEQFPSASKAQLANYLIAAYCPVVKADAALNEEEKQARVREFADKVVSSAF
jgi:hypothetical protein